MQQLAVMEHVPGAVLDDIAMVERNAQSTLYGSALRLASYPVVYDVWMVRRIDSWHFQVILLVRALKPQHA